MADSQDLNGKRPPPMLGQLKKKSFQNSFSVKSGSFLKTHSRLLDLPVREERDRVSKSIYLSMR